MLAASEAICADPCSVYGRTKLATEKMMADQALRHPCWRLVSIRLGNVFGSSRAVVPKFTASLREGKPLMVKDVKMRRIFITVEEAFAMGLRAIQLVDADASLNGAVIGPDLHQQTRITDLALRLAAMRGQRAEISIVGRRPGERLQEVIFSPSERSGLVKLASGLVAAKAR